MTKKQLKITLLPNGEIQMKTVGIKGKKCLDYIDMMKILADVKIIKQDFTEEYYEQDNKIYNDNIEDIKNTQY